jgi:hypothetical protein
MLLLLAVGQNGFGVYSNDITFITDFSESSNGSEAETCGNIDNLTLHALAVCAWCKV